jgi:hypothetical protein
MHSENVTIHMTPEFETLDIIIISVNTPSVYTAATTNKIFVRALNFFRSGRRSVLPSDLRK